MDKLSNKSRNYEVENKLKSLTGLDLGAQMDAHTGVANVLASLDVAESLQLLEQQIEKSATDLIKSNEKLAISTDKHSKAMLFLTGALVLVGILQLLF